VAKILLIDDEDQHNDFLKCTLENLGHEVLTETNAPAGYCTIKNNPDLDLVLLDDIMPILTGAELKNKILDEIEDPPAIYLITAFDNKSDKDFLRKPLDIELLKGIIELTVSRID
jgi:CheY-like chemotaxis protein